MQYSNMNANVMLSVTSHRSTANMEVLTRKTTRETASMHIITLITLLFLPGMFLAVRLLPLLLSLPASRDGDRGSRAPQGHDLTGASPPQTLFQSPVFDFDRPNGEAFRHDVWSVFAKVCFPMTAITITISGVAYWWARAHAKRRVEDIQRSAERQLNEKV